MTETDDERKKSGLSKEKTEQLSELMTQLEAKLKHFRGNADINKLIKQVEQLCTAAEKSDTDEIIKSVRNIAEGVIGGLIVEVIPADTKAWLRTAIIGAGAGSTTTKPQQPQPQQINLIVKVELEESLRALELLGDARTSFLMSVSGSASSAGNTSYVRFWCDKSTAVYLRLGLDKAWVEHPTCDEIEEIIENGSISSSDLLTMKETLERLIAEHKRKLFGTIET